MSQPLLQQLDEKLLSQLAKARNEPPWLIEFRSRSWRLYRELPLEPLPLYVKYGDLGDAELENVMLASANPHRVDEAFLEAFGAARLGPLLIYVDGVLSETVGVDELASQGVQIGDVLDLGAREPRVVKQWFDTKVLRPEDGKFIAMTDALFHGGAFIAIPKNTALEKPIRILHIQSSGGIASFTHDVLWLEQGASATVVWEAYGAAGDSQPSLFGQSFEVKAGPNSQAKIVGVQDLPLNTSAFLNRRSLAERDAQVTWVLGHFGGSLNKSYLDCAMAGDGSSSESYEVCFLRDAQRLDITSYLSHLAQHTRGIAISRGVNKDRSRSVFKGMIRIVKEAKFADAYLEEHAMILDKGASANPIPGLEIETNEVRATHSGAVAQIDEEQVYYLMTRGLSREEARLLLTTAYLEPLITRVPVAEARQRIRRIVADKWEEVGIALSISEEIEAIEARPVTVYDLFQTHYKYRPTR